jgi:hypothetical protein
VLSYLAKMCLVLRSFTDKPRVKLLGAGVIMVNRRTERTLNKVRDDQDIVEVKWSRKHRVTY